MANEELLDVEVVPEGGEPEGSGTLEHVNLVDALRGKRVGAEGEEQDGDDILVRWGKMTVREFDDDFESNKDCYAKMAQTLELFMGERDTYDYGPAMGKPRPCMPVVNKLVTRIYNRMASVITKIEPVVVPSGPEDSDRVLRVSQHMNWERRAKHPEWKATMSVGLLIMINAGSMFRRVEYDPVHRKKVISSLPPTDCVVAYSEKDMSPWMETVGRVTVRLRMRRNQIEEYGMSLDGSPPFFSDVDKLFGKDAEKKPQPIRDDEDTDPFRKLRGKSEGTKRAPESDKDDGTSNPTYEILERTSWERLPAGVAPDEGTVGPRMRRVQIWTERSTKRVLRAVIKEAEDAQDRLRFRNEMNAAQIKFENLTQEYAAKQAEAMAMMQQAAAEVAIGGQAPPMPEIGPPPQMEQIRPIRMAPVYGLIHYRFMESPIGFYGLGAGIFGANMNLIVNEAIGDHLVHAKMHAIGQASGFLAEEWKEGNSKAKGKVKAEFGVYKQTNLSSDVLQRSMVKLDVGPPGSSLPDIAALFSSEAELQMNAHESLSGEAGPSHESATAAGIRNKRVGENLNMAMENVFEPLAAEFKTYARLNATFLDNEEYYFVTEADPSKPGKETQTRKTVGRADYEADYDITFDSDVRLSFDEGLGENAMQGYQIVMQSQFADPNTKLAAEKKALRSLGQTDILRHYPDSIPEPPPPEPKSQIDENAGFMEEQDHPVLPDDPHADHLAEMQKFEMTGFPLSPTGKQLFDRHRRSHQAAAYSMARKMEDENNERETAFGAAQLLQSSRLP